MGRTEIAALRKALAIKSHARGTVGDTRGCLEVALAGLGAKVKKRDVVINNMPKNNQTVEEYVQQVGFKTVFEAILKEPQPARNITRILSFPNSVLKAVGKSRIRGSRGALLTVTPKDENEIGHAMAILAPSRVGKIGKKLLAQNVHAVVDINFPKIGAISSNDITTYINNSIKSGSSVIIRHLVRDKK